MKPSPASLRRPGLSLVGTAGAKVGLKLALSCSGKAARSSARVEGAATQCVAFGTGYVLCPALSLSPGAQPQRGALPSLPQSPTGTEGQPWPPGAGVESGGSVGSQA